MAIESSDGASLYYSTGTAGRAGALFQLRLGGSPIELLTAVFSTSFDVVDGGVHYLEGVAGETRLSYYDSSTRRSTVVARGLGTVGFGLAASRNGRAVLYPRVDSSVDDLMLVENFR